MRREGLFSKKSLDTLVRTAYIHPTKTTLDSIVMLNRNIENPHCYCICVLLEPGDL